MKNKHRQLCIVGTMAICIVYLAYRLLFTLNLDSPAAATFSIMLYVAELYGNILMFLYFFQIWDLNTPGPVPPIKNATVDVMIPTYNEEMELLRGTIEAALAMDYAHTVHVLDDGDRPELRVLCEELGANYFRRDSNIHAKAGNLNHALEQTTGEYVVIFDADHIAEKNFITRTIGYFCDDRLGFVQTPHAFYNFDSFQGTLNYEKKLYWEEGHLFYNVVQPGKNNWNAVSFCGSAAIFRREALDDVGLIAVESITEDLQTGIRIHANGWKSIYVNERLVSGLAAPDIETFSKQRLRWGEGNLGTIFYDNPITKPGLNFAQRLNYLASMLNWTTGIQKLLMYVTPILMLLTGIGPVAELSWLLIAITSVYLLSVWFTVKNTGNGYVRLIDTEITQMATFWTQCQGTWRAIFNRKNSKFVVTRKSGSASSSLHQFLRPHYTLIAASALAIVWAAARYFMGASEDISGMLICSILVLANCGFAWVVIRRALTQRRMHWRHPVAAHVDYSFEDLEGNIVEGQGVTKDLSEAGASLVCYQPIDGYRVYMKITAGDMQVDIAAQIRNRYEITDQTLSRHGKVSAFRYGLLFDELNSTQKRNLWHICTKYAFARHYHNFDPNTDGNLIEEVTTKGDHDASLPVQLKLSSKDSNHEPESLVTETINTNGFVVLSPDPLTKEESKAECFASFDSMFGPIQGNVTLTDEAPVSLGQMDLFARRYEFETFDGECRGRLASFLNHSDDPHVIEATSVLPAKTRTSFAWPASIVAGISAIAATIAIIGACFVYPDDALITKAILNEEVGEQGMGRLYELSKIYEANPTANEAQCLRLREAFKVMGDTDSLNRINSALADSDVRTTSAKLQRAYALEQLGRTEEAAVQFDELIDEIEELDSEESKLELLIGGARNAANRGEHERAMDLFSTVWKEGKYNEEIRTELAGLLAKQGREQLAADVLATGLLSDSDRFLMASLQTKLDRPELARKLLESIESPEHQTQIQMEIGQLELWSKNYDKATEIFESLLLEEGDVPKVQVSLIQSLSWGKNHRAALTRGYEFESQQQKLMPGAVMAMLESVAEVEPVTSRDQQWLAATFERVDQTGGWEEPKWEDSAVRFAHAIERVVEPDVAAKRLARMLEFFPESRDLQWAYTNVLYTMGDFSGASEHYNRLLAPELLPEDLKLRGEMYLGAALNSARHGDEFNSEKRYSLALNCFEDLMDENPDDVSLWSSFLDASAGTPRHTTQTKGNLRKIYHQRETFKSDRQMTVRLADAFAQSGNPEMALGVLGELELESDEEIDWRKANLLVRSGEFAKAKIRFDELIDGDSFADQRSRQVQLYLASAFNDLQVNDRQSSRQRYSRALSLIRPNVLDSSVNQTLSWKDFLTACAGLEAIPSQDRLIAEHIFDHREPHMHDSYFVKRLADVMSILDQHDKALPLLQTLLAAEPGSRELRLRLTRSYESLQRWPEANDQYRILLKDVNDDPQRIQIFVGAGEAARELGHHQKAKQFGAKALGEMRSLVQISPEESSNWLSYLMALNLVETVTEPDREITKKIYKHSRSIPVSPSFAVAFSRSLMLVGRSEAAFEILNSACTKFPENLEARHMLARILTTANRFEEAAQHYDRLFETTNVERNSRFQCQLLLEMSENERMLENMDQAQQFAIKAHEIAFKSLQVEDDPSMWQCYLNAAAALPSLSKDDHEIAVRIFDQWKSFEDNPQMLERLSDVLAKCGDIDRAIRPLNYLEQAGENSAYASIRIASLQAEKGDNVEAESRVRQLLKKLQQSDSTNEVTEDQLVDLFLIGGKVAQNLGKDELSYQRYAWAIERLRPELQNETQFETMFQFLNAVAGTDRSHLEQEDIRIVEEATNRFSRQDLSRFGKALPDALLRIDRADLAFPIIKQLSEQSPDSESQTRLIFALIEKENYEEALLLQQKLIAKEPGNQQQRYHYATNLHRLKKYDLAQKEFDQLMRMVLGSQTQMTFASSEEQTRARERDVNDQQVNWLLGAVENMIALKQYEKATNTIQSAMDAYMSRKTGTHELHFRFARNLSQLKLDIEARTFYDNLIDSNAFNDNKIRLAQLWLSAAQNSGKLNKLNTMRQRYQEALGLWRDIYEASPYEIRHWARYLDAMGGTQRFENQDVENLAEIYRGFDGQRELVEDITFVNRLIDVMIRVEASDKSLMIAVQNFNRFKDDHRARFRLANNFHALARFEEAERHYEVLINEKAFEKDQQTRGQMMVNAARNGASMGKFQRANEIFELLWSLGIRSRDYEVEHAVVLEQLGFGSQAKRIIESQPLKLDQKYRLASMYTSSHMHGNAHDVYEVILDESPDEEIAQRRDARSLLWMDEFNRAIPKLNNLRQKNPDDPAIFLMQTHAMFYTRNYDHALAQLNRRIENEPDDPKFWIAWLGFAGDLPEDREIDATMAIKLSQKLMQYSGHGMNEFQMAVLLARPLARSGKVDQAVALLKAALKTKQADPKLNFEMGEVMIIAGDYPAAVKHFEVPWASEKMKESVRFRLADALRRNGNFERAIDLIRNGDTEDVIGLELLSSIYIDTNQFDLAREISQRLIGKRPDSTQYQARLANTYLWEGKYEAAIKSLKSLHESNPKDLVIQRRFGQALLWGGQPVDANNLFLEMLRSDPNNVAVWSPFLESLTQMEYVSQTDPILKNIRENFEQLPPEEAIRIAINLASLQLKAGNARRAMQRIEPWIEVGKDDLEFQICLATVLSASGQYQQARSVMQSVMNRIEKNDPLITRARFANADILYRVEEYKLALEAYRDIHMDIESFNERESESILRSMARVYVQLGDLEEAIRFFEQANAFTRKPSEHVSELAGVLARAGYHDRAMSMLTPLESLPHSAYCLKASILAEKGLFRDASEIYRSLIAMDPGNRNAWLGLGDVSAWGKDYRTADFAYNRLLQADPNNIDVQARLARVYSWSGKHEDAIALIVRLLQSNPDDAELLDSLVVSASYGNASNNPVVKEYLLKAYRQMNSNWHGDDAVTLAEAMIRNGLADPALKIMEQMVKAHPANQTYRRRLADELHQLGLFDRADFHYRALLELTARNPTVSIPVIHGANSKNTGSTVQASWKSAN